MNTKAKAALAVILLFGAVHLGLGLLLSSASGQAIDATVPATGADVLSSPIRTNFSAIKSRVETLEGKFPVATTNAVPAFSNSSGALKNPGYLYQQTVLGNASVLVQGDAYVNGVGGSAALGVVGHDSGTYIGYFTTQSLDPRLVIANGGVQATGPGGTSDAFIVESGLLTTGDAFKVKQVGVSVFEVEEGGNVKITANDTDPGLTVQQSVNGPGIREIAVATGDDPTYERVKGRVTTTDATETTIATIATDTDKATYIKATIIARVTGGAGGHTGQVAAYEFHSAFSNVSGTVTERGTPIEEITIEDANLSAFAVDIDVDGTNLDVNVTGAANENVTWHAVVEVFDNLGS